MTDVALQHGCDVGGSILEYWKLPNPLFQLLKFSPDGYRDTSDPALLEHLVAIGYEIEDQDHLGQTVLLYAANLCRRRCLAFLEKLISLGANIHAIDEEGCGALHQALDFRKGLLESYLEIFRRGALLLQLEEMPFWKAEYYYDSDVLLVDNHHVPVYPRGLKGVYAYLCIPNSSSNSDYDDLDSDDGYFNSGDDGFNSDDNDSDIWDPCEYGDDENYFYVGDYDIDDFTIGKGIEDVEVGLPKSRQKTRIRFKLLILLEAGCDPNLVDEDGASPSDYARRENLWPQWEWALTQTGYIYDEDKALWIKDVSFSDIVDFSVAE